MSGTLTLVEFAKLEKDPLVRSVAMTLIQESQPMKFIPWETVGLLYKKMARVQSLPSVSRRKLNTGFTSSTGKTEPVMEGMSIVGGNIDVDKEMAEGNQTVEDVRAIQLVMKTRAMAYDFNENFINGDTKSDPDTFDGLKARCNRADMASQKIQSATNTDPIADSQTHALAFLAEMDRFVYSIDGHSPSFMITSDTGLLKINQALRTANVLRQDRDQFGQLVTYWGNCPIYDIGVKANQSDKIMGDEAQTGGSGSGYFSIYAVRVGEGIDFWGIQKHPLETIDKGLLEDAVTYRTNVNWPVGLAQVNKRAVARLHGLKS